MICCWAWGWTTEPGQPGNGLDQVCVVHRGTNCEEGCEPLSCPSGTKTSSQSPLYTANTGLFSFSPHLGHFPPMFTSILPATKSAYLLLGPWKDFSSPLCSLHFNYTSCSQRDCQWHHVRVSDKLCTIPRASLSSLMSTGCLWHSLLQQWFFWTLTELRPCCTLPHSPDYIFPVLGHSSSSLARTFCFSQKSHTREIISNFPVRPACPAGVFGLSMSTM